MSDQSTSRDRRLLATAIFRLFEFWHVPEEEQLALLGLQSRSAGALKTMRDDAFVDESEELMDRVRSLLRIYRFLGMAFSEEPELARRWMVTPTARLGGNSPLERINQEGVVGIRTVTALLEEHLF
jgi:uncharacterized protein (DUF2384 family)